MNNGRGMVYLVGAGPGDPELLTLKGRRILSEAEVLIYDRLASREFLRWVPESCRKIYVGKEPGHHSMKQEEINRVLVEWALKGKTVVRLKGGDPFVFGRGGEEIMALEQQKIAYETVPGVTSAIAALAHAGIPVTHRKTAQSFHVITGHTADRAGTAGVGRLMASADEGGADTADAADTDKPLVIDGNDTLTDGFSEYAKLPGTLIFLMGLSNLDEIVRRLLENGKDPKTPAAVVTNGTLPDERCVRASLSGLPEAVRNAGLTPPGIIVVGQVAAFRMKCEESLPLSGVSAAVTGTDGIYEKLSRKLKAFGADVWRAEISHVEPCSRELLKQTVKEIRSFSWVVFTSRNAVTLFFDAMREQKVDMRSLSGVRFAVVGSGTGEFLEQYGIFADYRPEEYTTAALAKGLLGLVRPGEKVLIPRAKQGSRVLNEVLCGAGIDFLDLPIYDIRTEDALDIGHGKPDYITFESGSGVRGFFKENAEEKRRLFEEGVCAVCIGKVTADVLKEYGVSNILVAKDYTADGIVEAILNAG